MGGNLCPEPREQRRHGLTRGVQRLVLLTEGSQELCDGPCTVQGMERRATEHMILSGGSLRERPRGERQSGASQEGFDQPDAMLGNMKHV